MNPLVNEAFREFIEDVDAQPNMVLSIDHSFVLNKDEAAHACRFVVINSCTADIKEETTLFVICDIVSLNYFVIYRADGQYTDANDLLNL